MMYNYPGTQEERTTVKHKFAKLFEVSIGDFYDPWLSLCLGHWVIDLLKFDEYLHSKYGNYEDKGLSMDEFITIRFGKEASELLEDLI